MQVIHRRFAVLVVLASLALALVAGAFAPPGRADNPPPGQGDGSLLPSGGARVSIDGPSYTIPVRWIASCQNAVGDELRYHHWSVAIHVTRTQGSHLGVVGVQSLEYVGVNDSSKGPQSQGMVVTLAPDAKSETFEVKLWVLCYGARTEIGATSITVVWSSHAAGTTTNATPKSTAPPKKRPGGTTTTSPSGPGGAAGGARQCVVPKLVGKTLAAARRAIVAAHCSVGVVRHAVSTPVQRGRVVSQTPAAGVKRATGFPVKLVVGSGPKRS